MKILSISILSLLMLSSCNKEPDMKVYQHSKAFGDSIIAKFNPTFLRKASLKSCELFKTDWDSIVVLPAYINYSSFKKDYNFENITSVKTGLNSTIYRDDITTLLLVKNNRIISYERIFDMPVVFSSLVEQTNSPIIRRNPCTILFLNKIVTRGETEYRLSSH